jgi:hypothetical protein
VLLVLRIGSVLRIALQKREGGGSVLLLQIREITQPMPSPAPDAGLP